MKEKPITKAHALKVLKEMVRIINRSTGGGKDVAIAQAFRAIVTALRGPDATNAVQLKLKTTAIIRWQIGIEVRSGLLIEDKPLGDVGSLLEENCFLPHFTDHIQQAIAGIRKLGLEKK